MEKDETVIHSDRPLTEIDTELQQDDFLISYGYRHIVRQKHLEFFTRKPINLHISYLPYNRGADPNLWSFLDNTAKGVTIHEIDPGLDTGDIILQQELHFSETDTLQSSYQTLSLAIENLFKANWSTLRSESWQGKKQVGNGSSHRLKDKEPYLYLMSDGWNTPISQLLGKANTLVHSNR